MYQWAIGTLWQQYDLVVYIRLRNLTDSRYPPLAPGTNYSLLDLMKKEYFHQRLSEKDEKILREQMDKNQVLWLLDGYDEIVQNIPQHLQYLFEQLLRTSHHILTSRPYLNSLSYNVQLEITGFTNDNIEKYVKQFFKQIEDELKNASIEAEKLLSFLEFNPKVWGIVHIPVNLELICSLWCDTDWSQTTTLTMTTVYDKMIEWLCRRHLEKQTISSNQMAKNDVYAYCHKELAFLESLAFNGMESSSIILRPKLLQIASKESGCSLHHQPHLLNIGILKSLDYKPIGTCIEADKNHYFVHLSFQEYFAARYLVVALDGDANQKRKSIDFIKTHKYNQRFELVFTFASGLLNDNDNQSCINLFWETLLGEPLDLIGLRHTQLVMFCIEETDCNRTIPRFRESISAVIKWINDSVSKKHVYSNYILSTTLRRSPSLVNQTEILATFIKFFDHEHPDIKSAAFRLTSPLPIVNPHLNIIRFYLTALNDDDTTVRSSACDALGEMAEKAATNEVINTLVDALGNTVSYVRSSACSALGKIGEKAATNEVINRLVNALEDTDPDVRSSACCALVEMSEKAANIEVINGLVDALGNTVSYVRSSACSALGKTGEKAATNEVINRLVNALEDTDSDVRSGACSALGNMGEKAANNEAIHRLTNALEDTDPVLRSCACRALGNMGEKAANNEVIDRLTNALVDNDSYVSTSAFEALGNMGEKVTTNKVIHRLTSALEDKTPDVRSRACYILGKMGEKAATNEVIHRLTSALEDTDPDVRLSACSALCKMGEKAATNEVINGLVSALSDPDPDVISSACSALGKMGEKAATNEVIHRLTNALLDTDFYVRSRACDALDKMGKKVATNKVIHRLTSALSDTDPDVRSSACDSLGKMGEKAATNEVIHTLTSALEDTDLAVISSACNALGMMGKKAANNKVINILANALRNTDPYVRGRACKALGDMGEKAANTEVINRLVSALGDADSGVRSGACDVLCKMGEKAATDEVINRLTSILADSVSDVRRSARFALGEMGEKAATNEVINGLVSALSDTDPDVISSACRALCKMGEKAATNEVINGLVSALRDTDYFVRKSAGKALVNMGEKAATSEVIEALLDNCGVKSDVAYPADKVARKLLEMVSCLSHLQPNVVLKLSKYIKKVGQWYLNNVPSEKLIGAFLDTGINFWLPIINRVFVNKGYGVTLFENTVVVYGNTEPVKLSFSNRELGQQLQSYFVKDTDESYTMEIENT